MPDTPSNPSRPSTTSAPASPEHSDKILVEFIEPGGDRRQILLPLGQSLLDGALNASIEGLSGQCGGAINCATCLCDIEPEALNKLPPQHTDELELLAWVDEAGANSRLSCQLTAAPELAGLVLKVVPTA